MPKPSVRPANRVMLDTSILVSHWRRSGPPADERTARSAAEALVHAHDTRQIANIVFLEFVCGIGSRRELAVAEAFLAAFEIANGWEIRDSDVLEARRIARRVPRDGKRRQVGDCLIRAIANRLRLAVRTLDSGFPRT